LYIGIDYVFEKLRGEQRKNKIGSWYRTDVGVCVGRDKENAGKL